MSQRSLEVFYEPNLRLARAHRLTGYNAGYAEAVGLGTFDQHQKDMVWRLLGDVAIGPESTVVDVGCGIGGPSAWISERYRPARLFGLDYCRPSIREARARCAGMNNPPTFLQADAHRLPLPDNSVDVIFNLESSLHYAHKPTFIAECRRTLKPGGVLCLGDFCTRYKRIFSAVALLDLFNTQFSTHARLWSPEDYLAAFRANGLRVERQEAVARQASNSLLGGLNQISVNGWRSTRGFLGRFLYLCYVEKLLRRGWLRYELFSAVKPL